MADANGKAPTPAPSNGPTNAADIIAGLNSPGQRTGSQKDMVADLPNLEKRQGGANRDIYSIHGEQVGHTAGSEGGRAR